MAMIQFYAGPEDNSLLREKITSLGLHVYESAFVAPGVLPETKPGVYHGYISFQSPDEMHPYSDPDRSFPYRIGTVSDPLIRWLKSYVVEYDSDKYIIHGSLIWDFEDATRQEELAKGKRVFGQLSRWLRKHWPPPAKRGTCRGPQAQKLIQFDSHIPRGIPPDLSIEYVEVPSRSQPRPAAKLPQERRSNAHRWHSGRLLWLSKFVIFPIIAVAIGLAIMAYANTL